MASLKEIKNRINSIQSTQKITAAMKMVSSAKLHHTQTATEQTLAYAGQLNEILQSLLAAEPDLDSPYTVRREVKSVAIVVCSSNTGLCGSFNANIWKSLEELIRSYQARQIHIELYPIGKKITKELQKAGYDFHDEFISITDSLEYEKAGQLAARLREMYLTKQVDQIDLLYHHFKNMVQQILTHKVYLPLSVQDETKQANDPDTFATDYILEPSVSELQQRLFPKMLDLQIYTTLLDTTTSEHAARMMAMQTANDNANELIQQLTLQYNKTRQQAITNELLDIMGGSN